MSVATASTVEGASTPSMVSRAVPLALMALALGLIGQLLFYAAGLGINFPIAIAATLAAAWFASAPEHRTIRWADAWLPVAALAFASAVALRGDRTLVQLDVLGSLALTGASVAAFGGLRLVDRTVGGLAIVAGRLAAAIAGGAVAVLGSALHQLPAGRRRRSLGRLAPVLRGLAVAVPLALIFVALFSSADAVFARWTERLLDWDLDLGGAIGRIFMALVLTWVSAGLLAFAARPGESSLEDEMQAAWGRRPRVGGVEALTVLIALDMVFGAFVVLQAAYLFGGLDTLAATGLTYAEYARRGFFELLAVAFLVGALVLAAESFVRARTLAYRVALIGLVVMTLVVLASAFLRLRLYQDAYGWTELRFYVMAAIFWLAFGAAIAIVTILANRSGWLLHGMLALSVVFGIAFNIIGPVHFVAERNLALNPRVELDRAYLVGLGCDAVPESLEAMLLDRPLPPQVVERILDMIASSCGLDEPANDTWQAWNLSRENARALLR